MSKVNCQRCGLECASRSSYVIHLKRKTPCEAKNADLDRDKIIKELEAEIVEFKKNKHELSIKSNGSNNIDSSQTKLPNQPTSNIPKQTVSQQLNSNQKPVNSNTQTNLQNNAQYQQKQQQINDANKQIQELANQLRQLKNLNNTTNNTTTTTKQDGKTTTINNNTTTNNTTSNNSSTSSSTTTNNSPINIQEILKSIDFESLKNSPNTITENIEYDDKFNVHALITDTENEKNSVKILYYECIGCRKKYKHKKNVIAHRKFCHVLNEIEHDNFEKYDMQYFYNEEDQQKFHKYIKYQMFQHVKHISIFLKRYYNLPQSIMVLHALFSYQIPKMIEDIQKLNLKDKNGLINLVLNEKMNELSNNYHCLFKTIV